MDRAVDEKANCIMIKSLGEQFVFNKEGVSIKESVEKIQDSIVKLLASPNSFLEIRDFLSNMHLYIKSMPEDSKDKARAAVIGAVIGLWDKSAQIRKNHLEIKERADYTGVSADEIFNDKFEIQINRQAMIEREEFRLSLFFAEEVFNDNFECFKNKAYLEGPGKKTLKNGSAIARYREIIQTEPVNIQRFIKMDIDKIFELVEKNEHPYDTQMLCASFFKYIVCSSVLDYQFFPISAADFYDVKQKINAQKQLSGYSKQMYDAFEKTFSDETKEKVSVSSRLKKSLGLIKTIKK